MRHLLYVAFPKDRFTEKEALRFLRVRAFPQRLVASECVSRYWRAVVAEPALGASLYTIQDDEGPLFVFQEVSNVERPPDR